jgi:hypothetical protein
MTDIGNRYEAEQKTKLEAYAFGVVAEAVKNDINAPAYFSDWDKRFQLKDEQIEYLLGKNMHDSIGDAIFVIDLINGYVCINS